MKIEAGKKYISRDGQVFGPVHNVPGAHRHVDDVWFDPASGTSWREDGMYFPPDECEHDLVAEYLEPVQVRLPLTASALIAAANRRFTRSDIFANDLNSWANQIHTANAHFYRDINTGEPIVRNLGELIALIHSEASEMLEGVRKNKMDDKLPHRKQEEVEAADILIRLLDYCGYRQLDLGGAVIEKLAYNKTRQDHTNEARRAADGKKF
jgi:NTP pyrophosphatase (non-canonical NTP hydrolase)